MPELDPLTKSSVWLSEQRDGEWEHGSGISINTFDNPGWILRASPRGTRLEDAAFEPVRVDKGEDDWIECYVKECMFTGAGDLSKITTSIGIFLKFAGNL